MSFQVPNYDDVSREGASLPSEGRHDVTLTNVEAKRSSNGNPMIVLTETVDNGEDAGHALREFLVFTEGSNLAWSRLANICDAADFEWSEASTLEAFAAQFPLNRLRWSTEVEHQYKVTAWIDSESKYNYTEVSPVRTDACYNQVDFLPITKEEWGDESQDWENKRKDAQVRDGLDFQNIYGEPEGKSELDFGGTVPSSGDGQASGEPVPAGGPEEDDLPF